MSLPLRLVAMLLAALRGRPLGILDESVVAFRVWLTGVDLNGHMNNGRYLTLMDLGRIDLIVRTGLAKVALRARWHAVVASATIRFFRSLTPFQRYQLKSRVICWDKRWFFIEQRFEREGKVVAIGIIKGVMQNRAKSIPTAEVLGSINATIPSPEMPPSIKLWQQSEAVLNQT